MAIELPNLPDEILLQVFGYLDLPREVRSTIKWSENARPSLYALSLTNRRSSYLAMNILYRCIDFQNECATLWGVERLYTWKRFCDCCTKYPYLLDRVRNLRLAHTTTDIDELWQLAQTIGAMTNLTRLRIELVCGSRAIDYGRIFEHISVQCEALQLLEVNIKQGFSDEILSITLLHQFCSWKNLRCFETSHDLIDTAVDRVSHRQHPQAGPPATNLKRLSCTGNRITLAPLKHLLWRLPNIEELELGLPGLGMDMKRGATLVQPFNAETLSHFSPAEAGATLYPLAQTLRQLSMTNQHMLVHVHDGSSISLGAFTCLEHLTLSIRFLCPATDHMVLTRTDFAQPENDWFTTLPPALKTLEIQYDCRNGLLWNEPELVCLHTKNVYANSSLDLWRRDPRQAMKPIDTGHKDFTEEIFKPRMLAEIAQGQRTKWISDLARSRNPDFPYLKSFKVVEVRGLGWIGRSRFPWNSFNLTRYVPQLFADCDLQPEVTLRLPQYWSPPPYQDLFREGQWSHTPNFSPHSGFFY